MAIKTLGYLVLLFFSVTIPARSFIQNVRQAIDRIKPFQVNFIQQVIIDGELEIEESGEVLFQDVSRLKWTYLEPDHKVFIIIKNNYLFYDRENNQLIKGEVTKKNQKWIWQLLFSDEDADNIRIDEKERIIYFRDDEEDLVIDIYLDENLLPEKVIQQDPAGVRYRYFFRQYRKKVTVSPKDFELNLPVDAEIIDGNLQ